MNYQDTRVIGRTAERSSLLSTHKVLRNTYMLLSATLLFSALTAGASMALGLPHRAC